MVDLARAVVVAGAGDHEVELAGDEAQLGARGGAVVLVVDLQARQPGLGERGDAVGIEDPRPVVATPWMGDDADAAGCADAPVATAVARPAVTNRVSTAMPMRRIWDMSASGEMTSLSR